MPEPNPKDKVAPPAKESITPAPAGPATPGTGPAAGHSGLSLAPADATITSAPKGLPDPPMRRHDETVQGGRFGLTQVAYRDGKKVETIVYVDAHGVPLDGKPDDPKA